MDGYIHLYIYIDTYKAGFWSGLIQITCKKGHLKSECFCRLQAGEGGGGSVEVQGVGGAVQKKMDFW